MSFLWYLWYPVSVCDAVCLAVCMCMCACEHKCVRPRACERGAVCVCDVAGVDIGKRAHLCAPLHVPVCAVVCAMVCPPCGPPWRVGKHKGAQTAIGPGGPRSSLSDIYRFSLEGKGRRETLCRNARLDYLRLRPGSQPGRGRLRHFVSCGLT